MSSDESVTHWIDQLRDGDPAAAQRLWERYFGRLVGLARARLQALPRRAAADEEDVALSAFDSFCRGAGAGRFPRLDDRDDLWRLLVTITARKAHHLVRDESRQKRGGGRVVGESALQGSGADEGQAGLGQFEGKEPTPEFAAEVAEECRRLLDLLGDAELRSIAVWKMEGDTNDDIAARLGCAPATVERRLALIRRTWERAAPATPP
jgi:DNA-directed RNA polymerase specialized sigma24 family protein